MDHSMMLRIIPLVIMFFGISAATIVPAFAEQPLGFILRSFAAEEQAPKKRADLIFRGGSTVTRYVIERVLPDRMHMHMREGSREQELTVIGDRMFKKEPTGWSSTSTPPRLSMPLSVVGLFENRLENVKEMNRVSRDGIEQRVFMGTLSWFSGRRRNEGTIRIFIEVSSGLPRLMTFKGTCGSSECSFEHAITYDPGIRIEAPVP